jgi:ribosomal subunit interface protein
MQLNIESQHIDMTDALRGYATEKAESLAKYADIVKLDVELGRVTSHQNKGDVFFCGMHVFVAGHDFFVKKEEEDIYKAIDKVKDHLKNEITTWKDKQLSERKEMGEAEPETSEDEDAV